MAESFDVITIDSLETIHRLIFIHMFKDSYEEIFKQISKKEDDHNDEKELKELILEILNEQIKLVEDLTKN